MTTTEPGTADRQAPRESKGAHPKFNHVAMSVPADLLDADGRKALLEFYGDVFGFTPAE